MTEAKPVAATVKAPDPFNEAIARVLAFSQEYKNETDRACVVLGAASLDHLLTQILSKHLRPCPNDNDPLFDGNGPLSTFSSRIMLTYRLGLIDEPFARTLHLIRKIRNDYAHDVSSSKLSDGQHANRIREIVRPFRAEPSFATIERALGTEGRGPRGDLEAVLGSLSLRLEAILHFVETLPVRPKSGIFIVTKGE